MSRGKILRAAASVLMVVVLGSVTAADPGYYTHETGPGDYVKKVDVDGRAREYRLHVPATYDGRHPVPVMFVFHGSSASADVVERETGFDERADSLGFIVVYPEGLHRGWNIGECCRYSYKKHIDETAFVGAILDELERGLTVDASRVYAAGYSDGGTLSFLLACAIPHRLAAVAGVSATLFRPEPVCRLRRPVPVVVIHGTGDSHIPYSGQPGATPDAVTEHFTHSAPEVAAYWVAHDSCGRSPAMTRRGRVIRNEYTCPQGASVLFFTIQGGEHGWPGGGRGWVFSPLPPTDMSATDSITAFFLSHRRQSDLWKDTFETESR